jgi:hypothetical protein
LVFSGLPDLALDPLQRGLRLSPHDPHRWARLHYIGIAHLNAGEHVRALPWFEQAWALHRYWGIPLWRAAAFAGTGQRERALELRPAIGLDNEQRQWNRNSRHPAYLSQVREHVIAPLVDCGALDDFSSFDAWAARQRRGV